MMEKFLPELLPAFEGVIPAIIATASADGIPNVTYVTQVYYVDTQHVALSRQFFNKTVRNIEENPMLRAVITCPVSYAIYKMLLRFVVSQPEGALYEKMQTQLEVIAGIQGMSDVFHLMAADIFEVVEIERIYPS